MKGVSVLVVIIQFMSVVVFGNIGTWASIGSSHQ